jgi:hypothetical protein
MSKTLRDLGIEIPPEEDTPFVRKLVAVIEQLVERIHQLEGRPALPKHDTKPSPLNDSSSPPSKTNPKKNGKKKKRNRKGLKRSKFKDIVLDDTVVLRPEGLVEGAKLIGYKSFIQQELRFQAVNIRYRRAQYQLPDGSTVIAPRPEHLKGHYGPELRCYVLQQYYQSQVTQPLILQQLTELGIKMSTGQLSRMLTEGHDLFHEEKAQLLPAARDVSSYFQTDDTTARHFGKNGHTLHIGNDFFAAFFTTLSKSRINFLEILRTPYNDYVLGEDALFYLEYYGLPNRLREELRSNLNGEIWFWEDEQQWHKQLDKWKIFDDNHRRLVTEAALWGSLIEHELYVDQPMLCDDAGQFKLLGFAHGLCWLHAERHVARMIPLDAKQQRAYDSARDAIWHYYQQLKAYRDAPTNRKKRQLESKFDTLFLQATGWAELNAAMRKIHSKKAELLLVLEHPELPLHNNLSENDIRQFAKMRKISGSTRSEAGRLARDTFLSLKTTCRKLGIGFWQYLKDRIYGHENISPLADIIRQKATPAAI